MLSSYRAKSTTERGRKKKREHPKNPPPPPELCPLSTFPVSILLTHRGNNEIVENLMLQNILYSLNFKQHIRDIKDPEHPYSLEQLKVVSEDAIEVDDEKSHLRVTFTPTVEHCSMATVIGLCLQVKLMRSLPPRYKVDIRVAPGTHATEAAEEVVCLFRNCC
ncbi:MIP18 family protein At1g68310 [Striga asiatica]|uniref:MIP18 family protein At1g68310 n=1 Tax=Striga asiatica TaxID=4170 RepID=A0A5A7PY82_STRAF|nr:MIP18 family protein At1g68310 [Striga asiatica]